MTKPNFESMSRAELRVYVTSHRDDDEAWGIYLDRLHNDPDVIRHTGDCSEEGLAKLRRLIEERAKKPPTAPQ